MQIAPVFFAAFAAFAAEDNPLCDRAFMWDAEAKEVKAIIGDGHSPAKCPLSNSKITPLYMAALSGNHEAVKVLIAADTDVDTATVHGFTPLYIAAWYNHRETVKVLLDAGANVNAAVAEDDTPLHAAAFLDHLELVKVLIDAGADVNAVDNFPVEDHDGIRPHGLFSRMTPLHKTASAAVAKVLIAAGGDVNAVNYAGETPLHYASTVDKHGVANADKAKVLLAAGADVNAADKDGRTPLHSVMALIFREIAEVLLAADAESDAAENDGYAVIKGRLEIAKFLIKSGADINATDANGDTPLQGGDDWRIRELLEEAAAR